MEKISPQVRILAIVLVLAGMAGMLALRTMGPKTEVDTAAVAPTVHRTTPAKQTTAAKAAAPAKKTAAAPAKKSAPAAATKTPAAAKQPAAVNAPKPEVEPTGFPKAVDAALAEHDVVVVSLVVPGARVDALAAAEAQAGAKLGGVGYLALNVLNERVAHALLTKLDTVRDPSVLVVTRSGEVALQLNGFVDRETVAQAAANASP